MSKLHRSRRAAGVPLAGAVALGALLAPFAPGCSTGALRGATDLAMAGVVRPSSPPAPSPAPSERAPAPSSPRPAAVAAPRYELLAGDLHCHVRPPDSEGDVVRGVAETVDLARREGLDFVVLTPHVEARFFESAAQREAVLAGRAALRAELAREDVSRTVFVLGMEYTDHAYGHVGASFADLEQVLADVPVAEARAHPQRFFERFVARGGLLVVNHPLVTPLDVPFHVARWNVSWRPWTSLRPSPPEIEAVDRLAQGFEAYNMAVTELRDRYLLGETEHSLRATLDRIDEQIRTQGRRISPMGGTDSHSHYLRATTFVLSEGRSEAAIRAALVEGRVCIRGPEACSLEARAAVRDAEVDAPAARAEGEWVGVGGAVFGVDAVEVRANGDEIDVLVDGTVMSSPEAGHVVKVAVDPRRCSLLRARVDDGFSAPIYVNCGFARGG
jgi:hypothetical protein